MALFHSLENGGYKVQALESTHTCNRQTSDIQDTVAAKYKASFRTRVDLNGSDNISDGEEDQSAWPWPWAWPRSRRAEQHPKVTL
jgi:hypothetical protein